MSKRPSLGFNDDEAAKPAEAGLDLSGFQPKSVVRPNKQDIDAAAAKSNFKSRESKPATVSAATTAPARATRRRRTGRSAQLNLKVRQDTIDAFYAIADKHGWVLGEAFEKAVELLEREHA